MLNVALRSRLIALGCAICGVWLAWLLANESYGLPALVAAAALLGTLAVLLRASFAAIVVGIVLFGYMVGNRGFAQLMPVPWLPLLPAECALLAAGGWMLVQCAFAQRLPFRRDALNGVVLIWLLLGTCRVAFDIPTFGALALRDYAMVYYALFFFLGQHLASEPGSDELLRRTLVAASVAQPVAVALTEVFPEFFLNQFVVRGIPLIYFKGDLALTFMAMAALFIALATPASWRKWTWPLASLELLYVMGSANRASMLGALAALVWLAFSPARRFVAWQAGTLVLAFALLSSAAFLGQNRWAEQKFAAIAERVISLVDLLGDRTYVSEESSMKGDNNRFRSIWWRTVVAETLEVNPVFGLGFGHDLSRAFLQEYNPEMADDFTARSPHSIAVSTLGRMGFAGLAILFALSGILFWQTWAAMRRGGSAVQLTYSASLWIILISACFGVVLEGPMGAVIFWTLLGLAHAQRFSAPAVATDLADPPRLRAPETPDEVPSAS